MTSRQTSAFQKAIGTKVETGAFAEGKLTLQIQPMRIDWVHEPPDNPGAAVPQHMGLFPGAADPLLQFGRRWARSDSFPGTPRVALGLVLTSETTDRASGYRELSDLIDGVPTDSNARDFMYQVNIPRHSKASVDGLMVNRLSRWSVALYRRFIVTP